jgi:hypothetical protein
MSRKIVTDGDCPGLRIDAQHRLVILRIDFDADTCTGCALLIFASIRYRR